MFGRVGGLADRDPPTRHDGVSTRQ